MFKNQKPRQARHYACVHDSDIAFLPSAMPNALAQQRWNDRWSRGFIVNPQKVLTVSCPLHLLTFQSHEWEKALKFFPHVRQKLRIFSRLERCLEIQSYLNVRTLLASHKRVKFTVPSMWGPCWLHIWAICDNLAVSPSFSRSNFDGVRIRIVKSLHGGRRAWIYEPGDTSVFMCLRKSFALYVVILASQESPY